MIVFPVIFYSQQGNVTLLENNFQFENLGDFSVWDDSPMIRLDDESFNSIKFGPSFYELPFANGTFQRDEFIFCSIDKIYGHYIYARLFIFPFTETIGLNIVAKDGRRRFYLEQRGLHNRAGSFINRIVGQFRTALFRASPTHKIGNTFINLVGIQRYFTQITKGNDISSFTIGSKNGWHFPKTFNRIFKNISNSNIYQDGLYDTSRFNKNESANTIINVRDGLYDTCRFYHRDFGSASIREILGNYNLAIRLKSKHEIVSQSLVDIIGHYYFSLYQKSAHNETNQSVTISGNGPEFPATRQKIHYESSVNDIKIFGIHNININFFPESVVKNILLEGLYNINSVVIPESIIKEITINGSNEGPKTVKHNEDLFCFIDIEGAYSKAQSEFNDQLTLSASISFTQEFIATFIQTTTPYKIDWTPPNKKEKYKTFRYFML